MVNVNEECVGCGLCVVVYPDGFILDDQSGMAKFPHSEYDESLVQEAIDQCPVGAITIS